MRRKLLYNLQILFTSRSTSFWDLPEQTHHSSEDRPFEQPVLSIYD